MSTLEEVVDALYADADVQRLMTLSATSEPLRICFPKEVNISRFIAWLLDPLEGHGLGDTAIRSILTRAGQTERCQQLPANDRRFLSAANVHNHAFSAMLLTTEVDVGTKDEKKLDVLAIDPAAKLYIAIENKFGAREGDDQTASYRRGLEKLFPGFRGVHLFLDSNEAEPKDVAWLPIGYDWLAEFLRSCEQRESVADHVKRTLQQFRVAIEEEDEDSAATTQVGKLVTHVASKYAEELSCMKKIVRPNAKGQRAKDLSGLVDGGPATNDAKATLRLFQLYCRRPAVWDQCLRQILFAPFHRAFREKYVNLQVDPRRVVTIFGLSDWDRMLDKEDKEQWYWCAGVRIRYVDEQYNVSSFVHMGDVRAEKRDALRRYADDARHKNGIRAARPDDVWLLTRRASKLSSTRAVEEALDQMHVLAAGLDGVR